MWEARAGRAGAQSDSGHALMPGRFLGILHPFGLGQLGPTIEKVSYGATEDSKRLSEAL
jgi:hypothetical protein